MTGLLSVVLKCLCGITIFSSFSYYMTALTVIHCIAIVSEQLSGRLVTFTNEFVVPKADTVHVCLL